MKRNTSRFLALFLSASMVITPVVNVSAEAVDNTEITAITEEAPVEETTALVEATTVEQPVESQVQETEVVTKAAQETQTAATQKAETTQTTETVTNTESETPAAEKTQVPVNPAVPAATNEEFVIAKSDAKLADGKIEVVLSTTKTTYDRLYVGNKADQIKDPIVAGAANQLGGYDFVFKLDTAKQGTRITVVPGIKADNTWLEVSDVYYNVPVLETAQEESANQENAGVQTGTDKVPEASIENINELEAMQNATVTETSEDAAVYGDSGSETSDTQIVREDGTVFPWFKITSSKATVDGEKIILSISTDATLFDGIYLGTKEDIKKIPIWLGTQNESGGWDFTVEVPVSKKGQTIPICLRKRAGGIWYSNQALYLKVPDVVIPATPTPTITPLVTVTPIPTITTTPTTTNGFANGIYSTTADTGVAMFKVVNVEMTIKDGTMKALITLSGTGYDYLYMGTAAQAGAAAKSTWIPVKDSVTYTDEYGATKTGDRYEVPVSAFDKAITMASHSQKQSKWYDRSVTFSSANMKKTGDLPGTGTGTTPGATTPTAAPTAKPTAAPTTAPSNTGTTDSNPSSESTWTSDLSGSTGSVDSSTSVADGVYAPDSFSWSGGSGRASISCNKVTIKGGQAYATIVFSSSSYGYVKANGRTYYGSISGNTTAFTIPVQLNKNNTIIGMTTKMSAKHEITYQIYVGLNAAKGGNAASGTGSANGANAIGQGSSTNNMLDETAPEIVGLEYKSETKLQYAEYFKMYNYDQNVTLLEIDMTKDTVRDPEKTKDGATTIPTPTETPKATKVVNEDGTTTDSTVKSAEEIAAELYEGNVVKYLIVPENVEVPTGLDKEVIVVNLPVEKAYVAFDEALQKLEELDVLKSVNTLGLEDKDCTVDAVKTALTDKTVDFAGKWDDLDYKKLLKNKCDFAILSSDILPDEETEVDKTAATADTGKDTKTTTTADTNKTAKATDSKDKELTVEEQTARLEDISSRFATLKVPMIIDRSADETEELAKAEWIKVYGILFGCSEKADKIFDTAVTAAKNQK